MYAGHPVLVCGACPRRQKIPGTALVTILQIDSIKLTVLQIVKFYTVVKRIDVSDCNPSSEWHSLRRKTTVRNVSFKILFTTV